MKILVNIFVIIIHTHKINNNIIKALTTLISIVNRILVGDTRQNIRHYSALICPCLKDSSIQTQFYTQRFELKQGFGQNVRKSKRDNS